MFDLLKYVGYQIIRDRNPKGICKLGLKILVFCAVMLGLWYFPLWYCGLSFVANFCLAIGFYSGNNLLECFLAVLFAPFVFALILFCMIFEVGFPCA